MTTRTHRIPPLADAILQAVVHPGEREETLADIAEEYMARAARDGATSARLWIWRQALRSLPALVRRTWLRGTTGFESEANRMSAQGMALESWIMDARFAFRSMRRRPIYLLLTVLTLGLGIGGTTAVFGIARSVLLNPLPYADSDRLVMFWNTFDWSEAELDHFRPEWPGFERVAGYRPEDVFLRLDDAPPRLVRGIASSAPLFDVLGARPLLGQTFEAGADQVGAEPTAVLSYSLWQEFGGRSDIVGSVMQLDGQSRRVVGVMPPGFWFPDPGVRVWLSQSLRPDNRSGNYALVGRLAPGVQLDAMADPLRRITTTLAARFTYPAQWDKTKNAALTPLQEYLLGPVRPALLATLAGMAVLLLMACSNVATLMLGQLRGRSSELAVRVALGAGRRRLMQQLLVESVLLGLIAGLVGAAAARAGFQLLIAALPLGELAGAVHADWGIFITALVLAFSCAVLIAMAPVVSLWRGDLRDALNSARSGGVAAGPHGGRLENALVVGEVALAVLVAAGAAVLIRSVERLSALDPGIEPGGVAVVAVSASSEIPWQQRWQHLERMLGAVRALPGVTHAAAVQRLPLVQGDNWGMGVEGKPDLPPSTTAYRMVTQEYFATMGIPLRRGRLFDQSDRAGSDPVVVVDEALARKYFPDEDPIGRRITHGLFGGWASIIGVVANVAHAGLTDDREPGRYMLVEQTQYVGASMSIVIQGAQGRDAALLLRDARTAIQGSTNMFAVQETTTMDNVVARAMGPTRRVMQLMSLIGTLALTLGAVGVYGVVSHFVNRRKRDWVLRMALGMRPREALRLVVTRGAGLVAVGCAIGLVASVGLTRFFRSLLYEVSPADPLALAGAAMVLIAVGCVAALIPGLRASRADPAAILRES